MIVSVVHNNQILADMYNYFMYDRDSRLKSMKDDENFSICPN